MKIQEALSNFCHTVQTTASKAAHKTGEALSSAGSKIAEFARKVADYVQPRFEAMKNYLRDNKQMVAITLGAVAVGALLYAIIHRVCCKEKDAGKAKFEASLVKA
jgi:hypothetical protein